MRKLILPKISAQIPHQNFHLIRFCSVLGLDWIIVCSAFVFDYEVALLIEFELEEQIVQYNVLLVFNW